jgi:hypothetical protein
MNPSVRLDILFREIVLGEVVEQTLHALRQSGLI